MTKKFSILTLLMAFVVSANAQGFKFGVHVTPLISLLASDYKQVEGAAVNGGVGIGVELEYYLGDGENYALTFGADFSINKGGSLLYKYGGIVMPLSDLDRNIFEDATGLVSPSTGSDINMAAFTKINYGIHYVEVPIGLKLRTNELGQSYMRAFFHIPIVKIGVPVVANARIFRPDEGADDYVNDLLGYKVEANNSPSQEPNVWKDVTPIQISLGLGMGVEYSPNAEGGLRIYAGVYYDAGLLDVTNGFSGGRVRLREPNTLLGSSGEVNKNPVNMLHNIGLRIGATF